MTVACPYCGATKTSEGKPFRSKNSSEFTGHLSVCTRNLPRPPRTPLKQGIETGTAGESAVSPAGSPQPEPSVPSKPEVRATPTGFGYEAEPPVTLEQLELAPQQGTTQGAAPAQPPPGQPVPPVPSVLADELGKLFKNFGERWNDWLTAEPGAPSIDAARWRDTDTDLAISAFTALDRKYGLGTIANWTPELLAISLVASIAIKLYRGFQFKGKLKGLKLGERQQQNVPFFNPQEEKDAAEAWEAELKGRAQGGGPTQ